MSEELLPCPFCGLQSKIQNVDTGRSAEMVTDDLKVGCPHCDIWSQKQSTQKWTQGKGTKYIGDEIESKLKELWNHRALTFTSEQVEAVKAVAEVMAGEGPCYYDHHGLCQAHHLRRNGNGEPECEVAFFRAAFPDVFKEGA